MAEILRKCSSKLNYNPNDIFRLLYSAGYVAFTTGGTNLFAFEKMTGSIKETNFFFLHSNQHQRLIYKYKQQTKP